MWISGWRMFCAEEISSKKALRLEQVGNSRGTAGGQCGWSGMSTGVRVRGDDRTGWTDSSVAWIWVGTLSKVGSTGGFEWRSDMCDLPSKRLPHCSMGILP